jgi:predicted ABC-type ATPase
VVKGGHNIPADIIERSYYKALKNLPKFMDLVDDWYLYDNSQSYYELIAKRVNTEQIIFNFEKYNQIINLWSLIK